MNTKELTRERISAFADGELNDSLEEIALAATMSDEGRADWAVYHQIGDILRSEEMAVQLSPEFSARLSARLEAEPTVIGGAGKLEAEGNHEGMAAAMGERRSLVLKSSKRWAVSGTVAAAVMASVAFIATPQLMVAVRGGDTASPQQAIPVVSHQSTMNAAIVMPVASPTTAVGPVSLGPDPREPKVDDYLRAHQRFSPSLYSTAQYARSATLATDSSR